MPAEAWYVLAALLAPIGYVVQDVVADAMTVEAVPRVDEDGQPDRRRDARKLMHTTMQTLGRVAIIGGGVLVALVNVYAVHRRRSDCPRPRRSRSTVRVYQHGAVDPGGLGARRAARDGCIKRRDARRLRAQGYTPRAGRSDARATAASATPPNWWILGGSLVVRRRSRSASGLGDMPYNQEIIFAGSFGDRRCS